jgi:hypothetical protein
LEECRAFAPDTELKAAIRRREMLNVLVVGLISTAAMMSSCTLTPMEFRHSSPEALHTKRCERHLLAKDGSKAKN